MGWLCLSRKRRENIVIKVPGLDDPIRVSVSAIWRHEVILGVSAPREVTVDREEIHNLKKGTIALRPNQDVPWEAFCEGEGNAS